MEMIDLDNLSKQEHYNIPEGYFDQLPAQMMNAIRKDKARRRNIWLSAVAAVMALVICSTVVIGYMNNDKIPGQVVADTQITTADSQLEDQMADYYSAEFAQMDYYNY